MYYVTSDIHSNYVAFKKLLKNIDNRKDQLFIIGDIIDRGDDGFKILDEIMNMNNVHLLLGNHELSLLNVYIAMEQKNEKQLEMWKNYWFEGGGEKSYHYFFEELDKERQDEYLKYLFSCEIDTTIKIRNKHFYLVHACPSNDNFEKVADRNMIYELAYQNPDIVLKEIEHGYEISFARLDKEDIELLKNDEDFDYIINPIVIVGHNPTHYIQNNNPCEIWKKNKVINIDCGSNGYYNAKETMEKGKRLACLCLNNMEVTYY